MDRKKFLLPFLCLAFTTMTSQTFERIESIIGLGNLEDNNGVAVADYDGDLDLDIFVVAKAMDQSGVETSFSKLFRNDNNGSFTDVTIASGLNNLFPFDSNVTESEALAGFKFGVSWGDYDNDGFPDLFFTHLGKVQLFHNEGDGTFVDKTSDAGITMQNDCINTSASWLDFNNDGYLDIYIAEWGACTDNSFYLNNGDGTFNNVTNQFASNLSNQLSYLGIPFDFNNDGWMDIYVSHDANVKNELLINQSGTSVLESATSYNIDNEGNDMGIAMGDYNNDGYFDLLITNIDDNVLYKNNGDNTFTETASLQGVKDTDWSWDVTFSDFDLDGDEDLFVASGFKIVGPQRNFYYENLVSQGSETFTDKTVSLNFLDRAISVGSTPFDYDNDGDLDLIVTNSDKSVYFYENKTVDANNQSSSKNWLKILLEGTTSNRNAVGTEISVTTANGVIKRFYTGIRFLSQSVQPVHFGLNADTSISDITIKWPSGLTESYQNLSSNTFLKITEGSGYQVLNVSPAVKVYGCTDPNSCNYNPLANSSDGSCQYISANTISGPTSSGFNNIEIYSYPIAVGSTVVWSVDGGHIESGQGTDTVTVKWGLEGSGSVSAMEIGTSCNGELAYLNVNLHLGNISTDVSVARIWNEALLEAIRVDFARPNVHSRNLFHTAVALYDCWAIYESSADPYLIGNNVHGYNSNLGAFVPNESIEASTNKAMSFAAYRLLVHRFQSSPGAAQSLTRFNLIMNQLGYDVNNTSVDYQGGDAGALGNYVAQEIINYGSNDGSNEASDYDYTYYYPENDPLDLSWRSIETGISNPNRWQPLTFDSFIDQSGNLIEGTTPKFLGPEWGNVHGFALDSGDKSSFIRNGDTYNVFHDPGLPPQLSIVENNVSSDLYKWNFSLVSIWSSHLDPSDGVLWDISPKSIGNIDIDLFPNNFEDYDQFFNEINGGDISTGHALNPSTNAPYSSQMVPRADYARVLAEFWADGPDSETPPGHWFTILNYVVDHPLFVRKLNGVGPELSPIEWDVKAYFILGGAMHDAAISAWSAKGWYDYIRPISAIRYMAELGQSTNQSLSNYHVGGVPLKDGYVEVVEEGDPLSGPNNVNVGKIKLYSWRGHEFIGDATTDVAGVGWILAEDWWPYQRPSFVTPPFAGYVSGHSTFSRAAAEVMTLITGDEFFPGGMGEFVAKKDEFLVFEKGPSVDVVLQWATYRDASDQTSLSRIWGGIHPPADDIPGRLMGEKIGTAAYSFAIPYFNSSLEVKVEDYREFRIFPNPVTSNEVFIINASKEDNINLYDTFGRRIPLIDDQIVLEGAMVKISLPKSLSDGIYILNVNSTSKLISIRN